MDANHAEIARELEDARRKLVILETYAERDSFTLYEAAMLAYGKDPSFFDAPDKALRVLTGERTFGDVNSLLCEMVDAVKNRTLAAERVYTKRREIDTARTKTARAAFEAFRAQYGRGTRPLPRAGSPNGLKATKKARKLAFIESLLDEIEAREIEQPVPFDRQSMPGRKQDFHELCKNRNRTDFATVTLATFEDYLTGLCRFNGGARKTDFYNRFLNDAAKDK